MKKTILVTLEMDVEDKPMTEDDIYDATTGMTAQQIAEMKPESIENYSVHDMAEGLCVAEHNPECSAGTGMWFNVAAVRIKSAEWKS